MLAKKTRTIKSNYQLTNYPDTSALHHYLFQSLENRGVHLRVSWQNPDQNCKFSLVIVSPTRGGETKWQFFRVKQEKYCLDWEYQSCDLLLIFNLITASCGVVEPVRNEGLIAASDAYRDASKSPETYYLPATQTKEGNSQTVTSFQQLLRYRNQLHSASSGKRLKPKVIDPSAIHAVMNSLRESETGLYTYQALLYFLEQEYFRSYRNSASFSIILIQLQLPGLCGQALNRSQISEVVRRISKLKRLTDMIARYDHGMLAVLLPDTPAKGAQVFAQRVMTALLAEPLPGLRLLTGSESGVGNSLIGAVGVASVPENCTNLGMLLTIAEASIAEQAVLTNGTTIGL